MAKVTKKITHLVRERYTVVISPVSSLADLVRSLEVIPSRAILHESCHDGNLLVLHFISEEDVGWPMNQEIHGG